MFTILDAIGTVTTKHGLVHGVKYSTDDDLRVTMCQRGYTRTSFDEPMKIVTCLWCMQGKAWPSGIKAEPSATSSASAREGLANVCGEIWLDAENDT